MPTRSSTSSMVTWSRLGCRPPIPRHDPQPSIRNGHPDHASAAGWRHRLARDGTPRTRPSPVSQACLLPSQAPCQQRGSCPDPERWDGDTETECRAGKASAPTQGGRLGWLETPPAHSSRRQPHLGCWPFAITMDVYRSPASLPPRSSPPAAPLPPRHLPRGRFTLGTHTRKRLPAPSEATGAPAWLGLA